MIYGNQIILEGEFLQGLSDAEFYRLCTENRDLRIERNENGEIILMTPVGFESSEKNAEIITQLNNWNRDRKHGRVGDSSAGFNLPDGSMLSPDAAFIPWSDWNSLAEEAKKGFPAICPAFLVELRSKSDELAPLKRKMQKWIQNGAQLAWLIDPELKQTWIYRASGEVKLVEGFDQKISGETILPGFELDLSKLN
ncbi:MAG: Uma2 family endonuclease [Bacteroidia bacterium]|nr:Uma2 family endonuclease [Bacteroidia bacterium]